METLPAPNARVAHAFTSVTAMRELNDGRLVVLDARDGTLSLVDAGTGSVRTISRRGSGPLEYQRPLGMLALADGRTLVQDPANARLLELAVDGTMRGKWAGLRETGAAGSMRALQATWDARGVDSSGRLYFDQTPPPLDAGASAAVPIVRLDPARGAFDTVATYRMTGAMQSMARGASPRPNELTVSPRAWPPRPEWSVTAAGDVAIVHPAPYHVSWSRNGVTTDGPAVAFTPITANQADRDAFTEAWNRGARGPSGDGADPTPPGGRAPPRKGAGTPIFSATMPPFTGRDNVRAAPDGSIWVTRARHVADSVNTIDVFDAQGRISRRVELAPHRRLVAFGRSAVYLVYRDPDDLEYVERVPLAR